MHKLLEDNSIRLNKNKANALLRHFDVIFFDLDGTLVDTGNISYCLYRTIFKQFNLFISRQKWEHFFNGSKLDMVLDKYLESIGQSDLASVILDYFEKNGDKLKMELLRLEEVKVVNAGYFLLKKALDLKKQIVLCTSSRKIFVDLILERLNMSSIFDFKICGDDVKRGKPYPDVYNKARMLTGNKKSLIVEDSLNGLIAAQEAKCQYLIIAGSHYLLNAEANLLISKKVSYN